MPCELVEMGESGAPVMVAMAEEVGTGLPVLILSSLVVVVVVVVVKVVSIVVSFSCLSTSLSTTELVLQLMMGFSSTICGSRAV